MPEQNPQPSQPPKEIAVQSAPPIGVLTDEERQKRRAAIRARTGRSMLAVEAPAGLTGYWARKDDTGEMARLNFRGFEIVHDDPKKPMWKANGLQADGTYVIGDVILMQIDSELYQMHLEDNAKLSRAMVEGGKTGFMEQAERQGVPTFETRKKG